MNRQPATLSSRHAQPADATPDSSVSDLRTSLDRARLQNVKLGRINEALMVVLATTLHHHDDGATLMCGTCRAIAALPDSVVEIAREMLNDGLWS